MGYKNTKKHRVKQKNAEKVFYFRTILVISQLISINKNKITDIINGFTR